MKIKIYFNGKQKEKEYKAEAIYEDGFIHVLPGSKIIKEFAPHVRGGRTSLKYRDNPEYVDQNGMVLKVCTFKSASTAAQFVAGSSRDGLLCWKTSSEVNLKRWLSGHPEEEAIYHRKKVIKETKPKIKREYKMSKNEMMIISLINDNPTLTVKEIAQISGLSSSGVWCILKRLKSNKAIKRVGSNRNGQWVVLPN